MLFSVKQKKITIILYKKIMDFKNVLIRNILLMALSGILLLVSMFCTNRNNVKSNEKDIFICGQQTPQWFTDEVNKISKESHLFKPVKVFLIKDNDTEYIAIEDNSKNSKEKLKIFLCSGKQIKSEEKTYASIIQKFNNNEARIIWPD